MTLADLIAMSILAAGLASVTVPDAVARWLR